ncbi:MAG: ABC transporter substrate-binding protein [bacterium]
MSRFKKSPAIFLALFSAAFFAAAVAPAGAQAAQKIDFILNWFPGADHAPYFYAKEQGWYSNAGLDVTISNGKGSGMSSQRVGIGKNPLGIADLATALVAKGKGADVVAVMNVYAQSPYTIYWLKQSGIANAKGFAGKTLGNPPWDAARVMWPALAKAIGIDKNSVSFVNISPAAKMTALAAGKVDLITDFYNGHDQKVKQFGSDMRFIRWSEYGVNPYGNSVIVNGDFLKSNRKDVAAFVGVTQRAFAACVANVSPCLDALQKSASGLKRDASEDMWGRVKELMTDQYTTTVALGYMDPDRVKADYEFVKTYFGIEEPFGYQAAFSNDFLDRKIKMKR